MAELIAYQDGNFTGSTTFKATETGTGALQMVRNGNASLITNITSDTFTVTNGSVIEGVMLWVQNANSSPTGTFKVDLQKGGVSQASVTVNTADLSPNAITSLVNPTFFKFTSTATGDGGSNWTLVLTVTGTSILYSRYDGTSSHLTRALRKSTTTTAAAGDVLNILGELTGAGTFNRRVVTMDSVAATAYGNGAVNSTSVNGGGIRVSAYGTLSCGTAASTNYILRVNGDVEVFYGGYLDLAATYTVTATIASPGVLTLNSHGFEANRAVRLRTTGALPTGFAADTTYYVVGSSITTNTFQLSTTIGGAAINTTGSQSGTHTLITGLPRTSSLELQLQMTSASGDFGLIPRQFGSVNICGLSRTSGKNVVKAKLTTDITPVNLITGINATQGSISGYTNLDAYTTAAIAAFSENATASQQHYVTFGNAASVTNTTQVAAVYLARGTGTHNRFVRVEVGNNASLAGVTNGFFVDVDLQAGTVGTPTAVGNGTATAASISLCGNGFVVKLTGKCSSGSAAPQVFLISCSASGTTTYTGDSTQCFLFDRGTLVTAASATDTTFNIDTDTGWLSGDVVVQASTTRTASECENFILNANAGASSFTSAQPAFGNYANSSWTSTFSGTTPAQGEVGLLSRNVRIRSVSSTLWGYVFPTALSTVWFSWAEFYWLGTSSTNKTGIELNDVTSGTAGSKTIEYCSQHDMQNCLKATTSGTSATSFNVNFSNNVLWKSNNGGIWFTSQTGPDWTLDNNLVVNHTTQGIIITDVGGTFTNNTSVGATSDGIRLSVSPGTNVLTVMGTFSGNVSHSNSGNGLAFSASAYLRGTVANQSCWRNNSPGVANTSTSSTDDLTFTNLTLFGNLNRNFSWTVGSHIRIIGGTFASETSFATTQAMTFFNTAGPTFLDITNVDMSGGGGGTFTAHTTDLSMNGGQAGIYGVMNNCKFGAPTLISSKSGWSLGSYIGFERYNQTINDHRTEMTFGQLRTDATIFNTVTPSLRMTPNNATNKLASAPLYRGRLVGVVSGHSYQIMVAVRKSTSGDGAAYNGNQPRLIQRANPSLGQNSDIVLATMSVSNGTWEILTGSGSTPTDDGGFECFVDCDGTAGWINVGDWSVA